jgi:Tol biopolymer transport system component
MTRRRGRLLLAASLGSAAAVLAVTSTSQATFRGPNGKLVYEAQVGANRQLFTINPDGTGLTQLTHFKDSGGTDAAWSADGSKIAFTRHWNPEKPNEKLTVYTINADGTGIRALPKTGILSVEPRWFPDGRRIIYLDVTTGRLKVINADGTGVRSAGVPGIGGNSACVFPDGKRATFLRPKQPDNDEVRAIFVARLFGKGVTRITPWGSYADKIDCSPDGGRIAFSKPGFGHGGKSSNVYTMRTNGTGMVQLTHDTGGAINDGADSWSPDGKKIAYVSNRSGTYQIWTMNADGSEATQLTKGPEAHLAAWGAHP